jgi:hypothetical protein
MADADSRLFIVCGKCGQTDHMAPGEWKKGGDGHHAYLWHIARGCPKDGVAVAVVPMSRVNEFYRLDVAGRIALLTTAAS